MKLSVVIILAVAAVIIAVCLFNRKHSESYIDVDGGVNVTNKDYQYSNPNPLKEGCYFQCLKDNCKGNPDKQDCSHKCIVKCLSHNGHGLPERLCEEHKGDVKDYAKCLIRVYSNNNSDNYFGGHFREDVQQRLQSQIPS